MKKTGIHTLLSLFFCLAACNDNVEEIFDRSATARYEEWINRCKTTLVGNEAGWRFDYATPTGHKSTYLLRFFEDYRVGITDISNSDVQDFCIYSFNRSQGPILVLTATADAIITPLAALNGNKGDIEFIIRDIQPEVIELTGKKNQDSLRFTKAIVGEKHRIIFTHEMDIDLKYGNSFFHVLRYNGEVTDVALGQDRESLDFVLSEGNRVNSKITYTENGFVLQTPVNFAGETITEFIWDKASFAFIANNKIPLEAANAPQYVTGKTASGIIGYAYDIADYSLSVENWYKSIASTFSEYKRPEISLNVKMILETRTIRVEKQDTTVISVSEDETDMFVANSFVFKAAKSGVENWNNFRGGDIDLLRDDRLAITQALREGTQANTLNAISAVRNLNSSFFNLEGHTVVLRDDKIYLVSAANAKNWMQLKKQEGQPRQIILEMEN
jgi:hypothetical protein